MAMLAAVVVINIFVIPAFANVYARFHAQLPLPRHPLITTSSFMLHYSLLLLAATIAVALAFQAYLGTVNGVERGESILRTAKISGVFTPVVLQMLAVGEEIGEPDDLMDEIDKMYEDEVDYQLRTLSSAIEPVLIVVLGMIVLVIALGIFLPMLELSSITMKN